MIESLKLDRSVQLLDGPHNADCDASITVTIGLTPEGVRELYNHAHRDRANPLHRELLPLLERLCAEHGQRRKDERHSLRVRSSVAPLRRRPSKADHA